MNDIIGKKPVPLIPAPNDLGYCDTCRFWREPEQEAWFVTDGQCIPKTAFTLRPAGAITVRVRTCCRFPNWKMTADRAWCGEHDDGSFDGK
jgi:hypothetical protein